MAYYKKLNTKESSNVGNQKQRHTEKNSKMPSHSLSVITLDGTGLNSPIKRQRLARWIREHDPTTCHLGKLTGSKVTKRLKVNKWKTTFYANSNQKRELDGYSNIKQKRL